MCAGRLKYPLALAAASENVAFELAGWRTSTGILLRKPILASLQLTPDVARCITTSYHNLVMRQRLLMEKSELPYSLLKQEGATGALPLGWLWLHGK